MRYQYRSQVNKNYIRNYDTLEDALKEFDYMDLDLEKDNPDEYGILYGIEKGKRKPTMKYVFEEGVWVLLDENKNDKR